ncbi:glycosyl hydrolase family 61-domain-containing protein [Desarmillaria tabescens]|uniref:AA9 family lytic polysaccharide monooxygenase n=1 Tax=Armillaria tabescens TaxID=1929756 RepID=A0AA39JYP8_ARMTA|nr:glycosyl hydrolase family 61-domain-containing protein [Desarmillaria tabescens]KAK0451193.1 glycosyl hydrolase family 61-domain-containing protein [Desarmillaria tabescens]
MMPDRVYSYVTRYRFHAIRGLFFEPQTINLQLEAVRRIVLRWKTIDKKRIIYSSPGDSTRQPVTAALLLSGQLLILGNHLVYNRIHPFFSDRRYISFTKEQKILGQYLLNMRLSANFLSLTVFLQSSPSLAHYIWDSVIAGSTTSSAAVRMPLSNGPVLNVTSPDVVCNVNPTPATATVTVAAGSTLGFNCDDNVYHLGPAAIYLGQAPGSVAEWDGSGERWFKIAEWGATFDPLSFTDFRVTQLKTTIPSDLPAGEYLARIEQIGIHIPYAPQFFISCAQIKITGGGSVSPAMVSIPGYLSPTDPSLMVNIYDPTFTSYTVPGPAVFSG